MSTYFSNLSVRYESDHQKRFENVAHLVKIKILSMFLKVFFYVVQWNPLKLWKRKTTFQKVYLNICFYKANGLQIAKNKLIKWNGSVYTTQLMCFMFIWLCKIKTSDGKVHEIHFLILQLTLFKIWTLK